MKTGGTNQSRAGGRPSLVFLVLIAASGLVAACSPCRVGMHTVPLDLGCDSGFTIDDCATPACYRDVDKCDQPTKWTATCKKDGRKFYCEAYPGKRAHCLPE